MRSKGKNAFLTVGSLIMFFVGSSILVICLLFVFGVLSRPRDFSSPQAVIRLVDEKGTPIIGIEVGRNWYDSDIGKSGNDQTSTDQAGIARFAKVPANVGVFTGAWRKCYMSLGMCGAGSGAYTTIYVRYRGLCKVEPEGKPLHKSGLSQRDQDGVWFSVATDSRSNTLVDLTFPSGTKNIEYALSSRQYGK